MPPINKEAGEAVAAVVGAEAEEGEGEVEVEVEAVVDEEEATLLLLPSVPPPSSVPSWLTLSPYRRWLMALLTRVSTRSTVTTLFTLLLGRMITKLDGSRSTAWLATRGYIY
jgi:hypothetical protein